VTAGATTNSVGSVALNVLAGDPGTTADESDVQIGASLTDVGNKAGLADYTGQLQARLPLRVTDRKSGPSNGEPARRRARFRGRVVVASPCLLP